MRFLADTCLISDVRRTLPGPTEWMAATNPARVFVSVMTIGELRNGILRLSRKDSAAALRLDVWLASLRATFAARTLPISEDVALRWAELTAQRSRPLPDALIAATALIHDLAVVTRNVADFANTGVVVVNPWETA